ncbi:hypothetical protein LJC33_04275 [Eubacteriales bacterium OttesenSCG-928-N13]|nr:hypothetical protein [Eubacteriales bacterium OttesenSCG-928-N13]
MFFGFMMFPYLILIMVVLGLVSFVARILRSAWLRRKRGQQQDVPRRDDGDIFIEGELVDEPEDDQDHVQ